MTRRLLLSYLSITVFVLVLLEVPLAVVFGERERDRIEAAVAQDASVLATYVEDDLEQGRPVDPTVVEQYAADTGARVVVVDDAGLSVLDTGETATGRDFSTRPEFAAALDGRRNSGTRSSETLGSEFLYVAAPVASNGEVHGAVRVTLDTSEVAARIRNLWLALVAVAVVVLCAVAGVGWLLARGVTEPVRRLRDTAHRFAGGDLSPAETPPGSVPELVDLTDSMNTMARRLDDLLASQKAFVADASHQLRTPLTSMRLRLEIMASELAGGGPPPDDLDSEIDAVLSEIDRLNALVNDLLRLARSEEAPPVEAVDLGPVVAHMVDTWSTAAAAVGVTIRLVEQPGPVLVTAVEGGVEQILDNLIDNAVRHSPDGATVELRVDQASDGPEPHRSDAPTGTRPIWATVSVQDEGPGLSDKDKVRAVQRFWRGDATGAGTGLGLAIVVALAEASGGEVALADAPGGGLRVEVRLPVAQASDVDVTAAAATSAASAARTRR